MLRTLAKTTKDYQPLSREFLLVHDGKRVLAKHGPDAMTGSGNPDAVFVVGTKLQIEAEIARLGLKTDEGAIVEAMENKKEQANE